MNEKKAKTENWKNRNKEKNCEFKKNNEIKMEEDNRIESLKVVKDLNEIGNELTTNVSVLMNEVNWYSETYFDQMFIPNEIENDNGNEIQKEIKRREIYFENNNKIKRTKNARKFFCTFT